MKLTIVMYHYIRKLNISRYPEIKGLDVDFFHEQIKYLNKYYNIISAYDLLGAVESNSSLPPNAILLTFDDGYIDHFTQVFPVLDRLKLSGLFFPPAKCILERKVLDVNKIHFILASEQNKKKIVDDIYILLDKKRSSYELKSNQYYWQKFAIQNRFDSAEVVFIKCILQREIPEKLRRDITNTLFNKYVTLDEAAFAEELYMSIDQVSHLQRNSMYIGSHGYSHCWLDSVSENDQIKEVDLSLQFLKSIGNNIERWIMCYPYGAYNETLLRIITKRGCVIGLTTNVDVADLNLYNPLTLPRLDTNDLPKNVNAEPNEWTIKAIM